MEPSSVLQTKAASPLVFVVDDEQVIAWTVVAILNKHGFNAKAFERPNDLIAGIRELEPDLVISDVVMPQMTGLELASFLRAEHPRCKIMLCSGQAATSQLIDSARKEGNEFEVFPKPFNPRALLAHVRSLLTETLLTEGSSLEFSAQESAKASSCSLRL